MFLKTCRKCFQKGSQNGAKIITSASLDAFKKTLWNRMPEMMQHVRKCLPKWTPKSMKNRWKSTPRHHMAPLGLTMASLVSLWGYPSRKSVPKSTENMLQNTQNFSKNYNVWKHTLENLHRKIDVSWVLTVCWQNRWQKIRARCVLTEGW